MAKKKHKAAKASRAERALDDFLAGEVERLRGRRYDGATVGRRGEGFSGGATAANVEIGAALARLRNRSRDLVRNNPGGERVLAVKTGHTIGTGIVAVPDNGSDRLDRQAAEAWAEWCERSDIEGVNNFGGQQEIAYRSMLEGGDSLLRKVNLRLDEVERWQVPLKLQVLEGDFIDGARDLGIFDQVQSRLGVGLGPWDRRLGYWLHTQHPGDLNFYGSPFLSKFVDRTEVIHLYRPLRAGQVRGVPVFAPVLMNARDLADLMDAILVKARTEACFTAFVKRKGSAPASLGAARANPSDPKQKIERLAPGMVNYLEPDEEVDFAQPTSAGQFEQVWLAGQMGFAAGTGLTHDQLTGDLRQANYSSLRAGKIEQRRLTEQEQTNVLVPQLMQRVTEWFTQAAVDSGRLRRRPRGYRWTYVMPAVEPIDPRKDLEADILAVRAGRITPQEFIGSYGQDWRKVIADTKAFFDLVRADGLVLDIDPSKTSQLGVAQKPASESSDA